MLVPFYRHEKRRSQMKGGRSDAAIGEGGRGEAALLTVLVVGAVVVVQKVTVEAKVTVMRRRVDGNTAVDSVQFSVTK